MAEELVELARRYGIDADAVARLAVAIVRGLLAAKIPLTTATTPSKTTPPHEPPHS